jgi:hypothetical protein
MGYDLGAPWPGILTHHSDDCPARLGRLCTCGPLGYRTCIDDPALREPVLGPVLPTVEGARAWQRVGLGDTAELSRAPPTMAPPIVGRLVRGAIEYVHGSELPRRAAGPSPRTPIGLVPDDGTCLWLTIVSVVFAVIALVLIAATV